MINPQMPQVLAVAKSQVGLKEGYTEGGWTNRIRYADEVPGLGWAQLESYCATFTSWVAMRAGVASLFPRTADCAEAVQWFNDKGRWSWFPALGAQSFYGTDGQDHTGIVIAYDATFIWAVEANTNVNGSTEGDGVYIRKRRRSDANVYGYGVPAYAEGVITADSTKQGVSGFTYAVSHDGPGPTELLSAALAVKNLVAETVTVNGAAHSGRQFIQQFDGSTVALEIIGFTGTGERLVLVKDPDGVARFEIAADGTITHRALSAFTGNVQIGSATADAGGGSGVVGIKNATTLPTTNPSGGGVLFVDSGALKWRGSNGSVTTIAPA